MNTINVTTEQNVSVTERREMAIAWSPKVKYVLLSIAFLLATATTYLLAGWLCIAIPLAAIAFFGVKVYQEAISLDFTSDQYEISLQDIIDDLER